MPDPTLEPKTASTEAGDSGIPDELLEQPIMQALMAGSPPAVSGNIKTIQNSDLGKMLSRHGALLQQAGMGFYRAKQKDIGVMFNQLYINPQDIVSADEQGQLTKVAPPIEEIEKALAANPAQNPVLSASGPPQSPAMAGGAAGAAAAPSGGEAAPNPRVQTARRQNVQLGSPTSGPKPGAGRVLNAILKPVV